MNSTPWHCRISYGSHQRRQSHQSAVLFHSSSVKHTGVNSDTWSSYGARTEDEAYSYYVQGFRRDVGIAVAREFARYRLLRVPFIGVPREVVRDRNMGRREVRAVPAEGPMPVSYTHLTLPTILLV